jgi:Lrp/AsnC family leucine-responsive transcriptional regulator
MATRQLDETDIRILQILQENARLTGEEIGSRIHKAPPSVNRRIRLLQDEGYIQKYVAVLDHKKLKLGFVAFTHVQLKSHTTESFEAFVQMVDTCPQVLECHQLAGNYDFVLKIAAADTDAYADFLMKRLFPLVITEKVSTGLVLRSQKTATALPLQPPNFKI